MSRRLKSLATWLFIQQLVQINIKATSHYWPFVKGIRLWSVDCPDKGPVIWKAVPYQDVIMEMGQAGYVDGLPVIWWRHQMETFSALLAICAGNSQVPGEFLTQRPVTRNFDVFFDLSPNKLVNKQSWGWWFETPSHPLWRYRNDVVSTSLCRYNVTLQWRHRYGMLLLNIQMMKVDMITLTIAELCCKKWNRAWYILVTTQKHGLGIDGTTWRVFAIEIKPRLIAFDNTQTLV